MPEMISCTIMGTIVRIEGLLNEALENIGIWTNYDTKELIIDKEKAAHLLTEMIRIIENGVIITENGRVNGITVHRLREDVETLENLFYWTTIGKEAKLIFK